MNRKPVIYQIPDFEGRTIVISDIHGNDTLFERLLKKVDYQPGKDRLILLGDLIEKGSENMKIVHRVMDLVKEPEVYAMMGNCDFVAKNVLYGYRLDFLRSVLLGRKNSLLHEIAESIGLPPLDQSTDMNEYAAALRQAFLPELTFLNDLPHVLVTPTLIYAHSGIENEETIADDFRQVMARFRFEDEDNQFFHTVIVGHMPVSEYCAGKADFSPRVDHVKNIVSIDGGNEVKKAGQLNALILHEGWMESISEDLLDEVRVLHTTRPHNFAPFYLTWNQGEVEILETKDKFSRVFSRPLHRSFWIDNAFLQDSKGSNYTNYEMPLTAGETVRLVNVWDHKAQIKKNSILGWTDIENLDLSEEQKSRLLDLR